MTEGNRKQSSGLEGSFLSWSALWRLTEGSEDILKSQKYFKQGVIQLDLHGTPLIPVRLKNIWFRHKQQYGDFQRERGVGGGEEG